MESLGMWNEDIFRAATGFADGIGLRATATAGRCRARCWPSALSVLQEKEEFHRRGKMMKALLICRELENRFNAINGTCRCHDLQVKFYGRFFNLIDLRDLEAAFKAGVLERCSSLAGK
jgi:hypothetical protein